MTANPNPGASGSIACPACGSAIGQACVSQVQMNGPVPSMLHPHAARVAEHALIARAAREAELAAVAAAEQARLARRTSQHEHVHAMTAAAAAWLDQAAAVTPPGPEILDHIREGLQTVQGLEDHYHQSWLEQRKRDKPPAPVVPAPTPETAPLYEHMRSAHGYDGRLRGQRHLRDRAGNIDQLLTLHRSVVGQYPEERNPACEPYLAGESMTAGLEAGR